MIGWQHFKDRLASLRGRPALDALLTHARPDQPLAERVAWAEDLLSWVTMMTGRGMQAERTFFSSPTPVSLGRSFLVMSRL